MHWGGMEAWEELGHAETHDTRCPPPSAPCRSRARDGNCPPAICPYNGGEGPPQTPPLGAQGARYAL